MVVGKSLYSKQTAVVAVTQSIFWHYVLTIRVLDPSFTFRKINLNIFILGPHFRAELGKLEFQLKVEFIGFLCDLEPYSALQYKFHWQPNDQGTLHKNRRTSCSRGDRQQKHYQLVTRNWGYFPASKNLTSTAQGNQRTHVSPSLPCCPLALAAILSRKAERGAQIIPAGIFKWAQQANK